MYEEFEKWLNRILDENLPLEAVGINFDIYEETDSSWSIQLVATERFDPEDEDWVCDEVFTTGEDLYSWQQEDGWETILELAKEWVQKYLEQGKYSESLKGYEGVGVGFVDGDVWVMHQKEDGGGIGLD